MNVLLELLTYLFVFVLGVLHEMVPVPFWLKEDIHFALFEIQLHVRFSGAFLSDNAFVSRVLASLSSHFNLAFVLLHIFQTTSQYSLDSMSNYSLTLSIHFCVFHAGIGKFCFHHTSLGRISWQWTGPQSHN